MLAVRGNSKSLSHRVRTTVSIETHGCSVGPVEFSLLVLTIDHTKQPVTQTHSQVTVHTKDEGYDEENHSKSKLLHFCYCVCLKSEMKKRCSD